MSPSAAAGRFICGLLGVVSRLAGWREGQTEEVQEEEVRWLSCCCCCLRNWEGNTLREDTENIKWCKSFGEIIKNNNNAAYKDTPSIYTFSPLFAQNILNQCWGCDWWCSATRGTRSENKEPSLKKKITSVLNRHYDEAEEEPRPGNLPITWGAMTAGDFGTISLTIQPTTCLSEDQLQRLQVQF